MDNYVRNAVKEEVNRVSPPPKTARVVSIGDKYCEVTYTGESTVVKVPYNNLAPSYEGQVVLIDGPAGDRRIVEVMGRTSIESRIEDVESFSFSPPIWLQSLTEYPETYPLIMSNNLIDLGTTYVNASPMVAPTTTSIARLEIRTEAAVGNATLKMSLYTINKSFTLLSHVQTASVSANTLKPGFNLSQPLPVNRDDLLVAVVSRSGGDLVRAHSVKHPALLESYENQFSMGNFNPSRQGGDVTGDLVTPSNMNFTMWAVGLTYSV